MKYCKLFDTMQIKPILDGDERVALRDQFFQNSSQSLRVKVVATHAGRVTRNNGFYLPNEMKKGTATWTKDYNKPFLVHHDAHKDAVGRIVGANYIDTSGAAIKDYARAAMALKQLSDSNTPYLKSVDLASKLADQDMLSDPEFEGLGYILLEADITDEDAIKKVLNGIYLTVSTGARTDRAVCSICKTDLVQEGFCEHEPGQMYDGQKCFIIAGSLEYFEISWVNSPADSIAKVIEIGDSDKVTDQLIVTANDERQTSATFSCIDSKSSKQPGGSDMEKAWKELLVLLKQDEASADDKKEALDKFIAECKDEDSELKALAEAELEKLAAPADNAENPENVQDGDNAGTEEDQGALEDSEDVKHYNEMIDFAIEMSFVELEDHRRSPEKVKSCKNSMFAKAGRKYLADEELHNQAAYLFARKNEEPEHVIDSIRRKALALGINLDEEKLDKFIADSELPVEDPAKPVEPKVEDEDNQAAEVQECEECKTLKTQLDALRYELKHLQSDIVQDENIFAKAIEDYKKMIADLYAKISLLKDVDSSVETSDNLVELGTDEFFGKVRELTDSVDFESFKPKENDGMSNKPNGAPVENPAINITDDSNAATPDKSIEGTLSQAADTYKQLLRNHGRQIADRYLNGLKESKTVPVDFDPNKVEG
jgi:hypothetical protein